MLAPYPGYTPAIKVVEKTGGYTRTCMVVELLSLDSLTAAQLTHIKEQLEAALGRILPSYLEKVRVILPEQFDSPLREGLRLPATS